jgi:hypothetical protein
MGEATKRPLGVVLLASTLLAAGVLGLAAFWAVVPRTSGTSPLAALLFLLWSATYLTAALLTWRRSALAPSSFVAAVGLLLFPAAFIVPEGQILLPSCIVVAPIGYFGHRYLRHARASH